MYTLVPGGSTTANLVEPFRTTSVQGKQGVCIGLSHEFGVVRLYILRQIQRQTKTTKKNNGQVNDAI